ncbi:myo-inositol-1(or 4)-monophosphatase [Limimonas halophila]|uniref:Myo-inositol-1(Or 4)-monophosphatase n=1 Tax=Limimonas halophila TaxID=1082479 RepID=A0A1G7V9Q1_9PROT|nr:inositol monophosphatase family protein [Limimonas halophila]SDG56271.1 myo-inositol-1(or 4)-monophosphatase [Limimonas halophila]
MPLAPLDPHPDPADLALAERLADMGREITLRHFRGGGAIASKDDLSPVSVADLEAEDAMRAAIAAARPDHGIEGEERSATRPGARCVWHIDPLDGTRPFATGTPTFATLITLVVDGLPLLGVVELPALAERWLAVRGQPTVHIDAQGRRQVRARRCTDLANAWLSTSRPYSGAAPGARIPLMDRVAAVEPGGDSLSYGLLASGRLDLAVDAGLDPHDYLPLKLVVEGAGGVVTDCAGQPLPVSGIRDILAAATPELHAQAVRWMR